MKLYNRNILKYFKKLQNITLMQTCEETIWKELAEATTFGIMVDESTDISCEPHFIIYVKYYLLPNSLDESGLWNNISYRTPWTNSDFGMLPDSLNEPGLWNVARFLGRIQTLECKLEKWENFFKIKETLLMFLSLFF
ncbi:hypothetical protein C1646_760365 [Rhizophagus diaphanus]|nr:hypothetical protein C1646_760365 [Rhizophagus diaphanus] [Rhizophagus sp. MUCL 43196]